MRPLSQDGPIFVYGLLISKYFAVDGRFFRFSDFLLQTPAVLWLNFFGAAAAGQAKMILFFCYTLVTPLGTLLALWLCRRYQRWHLAVGPLLSFGLHCMALAGFSFSSVSVAQAVFWPVYFFQVYGNRDSWEGHAFWILAVVLAFGHETSVLLTLLLFLFAYAKRDVFAMAVNGVASLAYVYRYITVDKVTTENLFAPFWDALFNDLTFFILILGSLAVATVAARAEKMQRVATWKMILGVSSGLILASYIGLFFFSRSLLCTPLTVRLSATLFLTVTALITWLLDPGLAVPRKFALQNSFRPGLNHLLGAATVAALVWGFTFDLKVTRNWQVAVQALRNYGAEHSDRKCLEVTRDFYDKHLADVGAGDFALSDLWILIQPGGVVNQFLWIRPDPSTNPPAFDPCANLMKHPWQIQTAFPGASVPMHGGVFQFRFVSSGAN